MYAVEFSHRSGRDLINVAKKRTNIIPIIEDARHPHKYRMLVGESVVMAFAMEIQIYSNETLIYCVLSNSTTRITRDYITACNETQDMCFQDIALEFTM